MPRPRVAEMRRRPKVRDAPEDEDDGRAGTWVIRADEPQESVEDPFGLQRPADRDDHADPEGLADSLSELPEARMVRTPGPVREVLRAGNDIERVPGPTPVAPVRRGLVYPEWDHRLRAYRARGAIVREPAGALGDAAWVEAAKARHGRLARRVRARFERLRPRHVRLDRQADGSEPDIAAWVGAVADMRAGAALDGRVYVEHRPARRQLAVALLADVSASTDGWVSDNRRIVDVEKEALLVVCEVLDARATGMASSRLGESAEDVAVCAAEGVRRAQERCRRPPDRRARRGPLHARGRSHSARDGSPGARTPTRRLLLIVSDGKPNDVDVYEGLYGVEDTRQAVAEARREGVTVFCLTVDREAPRYARRHPRPQRTAVPRRTDELPAVVIEVLRGLVRG